MVTSIALLILSLIALFIGADWLVHGGSALAARAKISPLVIGLTIVAFGTSAPEFVVSINAALTEQGDIAAGNVIGSNIFNICVIVGISAALFPLQTSNRLTQINILIMLLASIVLTLCLWKGRLGRIEGILLVSGIIAYTGFCFLYSKKNKEEKVFLTTRIPQPTTHGSIDVLYIVGGIIVLTFASHLLVSNAITIAHHIGISEAIIGLTIVAVGTSLPELATSVVASFKKNPEMAMGNIIGSNIFNILAILGISSIAQPISTKNIHGTDLLVMLGVSALLLPLARKGQKITRAEGIALVITYILYLLWLLRDFT